MDRKYRLAFIALMIVASMFVVGAGASRALAQEDGGDTTGGQPSFCTNPEKQSKMAAKLAETYGVTYDQVKAWRCTGGYSFGQISMALQTSQLSGDSPDALLAQHGTEGGNGWGKIWKDKGLVRNEKDGGPPEWAGHGRPPWAGPKHERSGDKPGNGNGGGNGNGNGDKPCWAGNPDPLPEGCVKPTDEPSDGS